MHIDEQYFDIFKKITYKNYHDNYAALEEYSPANITKNEFLKEEIQSIKDMQKEAQSAFELYDKLEKEHNLKFAIMLKKYYQEALLSYNNRLKFCEKLQKRIM